MLLTMAPIAQNNPLGQFLNEVSCTMEVQAAELPTPFIGRRRQMVVGNISLIQVDMLLDGFKMKLDKTDITWMNPLQCSLEFISLMVSIISYQRYTMGIMVIWLKMERFIKA